MEIRDRVNKALEEAKAEGRIGRPREAQVDLLANAETYSLLDSARDALGSIFLVSGVDLSEDAGGGGLSVSVSVAPGERCARCWFVRPTVGR